MSQPKFKIYPSLLTAFTNYINEVGYEKEGEQIPFVTFEGLIDKINRVPEPTGDAAKKGIDFENVLFGKQAKFGYVFEDALLHEVRRYLPNRTLLQQFVEHHIPELDVQFYGYVDVFGEGRVIDIKTSNFYSFPNYINDSQWLYLKALEKYGAVSMEYVITNFRDVFREVYHLNDIKFDRIYDNISHFCHFLTSNKDRIVNVAVFGRDDEMQWMTEKRFNSLLEMSRNGFTEEVKNEMCKCRMKTVYRSALCDALFQVAA